MLYYLTLNKLGRKRIYNPNGISLKEFVNILIDVISTVKKKDDDDNDDDHHNDNDDLDPDLRQQRRRQQTRDVLIPFINAYDDDDDDVESATLGITYGLLRMVPGLWT